MQKNDLLKRQRAPMMLILVVIVAGVLFAKPASPAAGQSSSISWSAPEAVSLSPVFHSSPRLLADRYGRLHAFWIESTSTERNQDSQEAVFYTVKEGDRWKLPTDVAVVPGVIRDLSVSLDEADRFHMLLVDQQSGALLYSYAEMAEAMDPRTWSAPQRIVPQRVFSANLSANAQQISITFTLWEDPFEVFFVRSNAAPISWSDPFRVSDAVGMWNELATGTSLSVALNGDLFLVWSQQALTEGTPTRRIMFSSFTNGGQAWSEAVQLVEGPYGSPLILAASDGLLYFTYNGAAGTGGRYLHYSTDAGVTWSEQVTIAPGVGGLTGGTMALDCAGTLHYASASHDNVGGDLSINGIAYSRWMDNQWEPMRNVAGIAPGTNGDVRQGYEPALAVTHCNQVHILYLGANHQQVFYTMAHTDAPRVEPIPYVPPTLTATPSPITNAGPDADISATAIPMKVSNEQPVAPTSPDALSSIAISFLFIVAFNLVVLLAMRGRFSGRWK
jgi:hypothetical protein